MKPLVVVAWEETHGVVQHALTVAALTGAEVQRTLHSVPPEYDLVHVPFTDALWGRDIARAARTFEQWASAVQQPVVVTLHDVPGADPDPERDARRTAGYARVAATADAVITCSAQEADRMRPRPHVVPLPLEPLAEPDRAPAWADELTVGVLGFVYPGKGHERVIAAAAGTGARVVAIGGPSPGHAAEVAQLHAQADALGVDLLVTGSLPEAALHAAARAVTVPAASYSTTGASGSLMTWLAAGRRPVTTRSAYVDELAAREPGALLLTDDLASGLRAALADPTSTWATGSLTRPDVAAMHHEIYRSVLR